MAKEKAKKTARINLKVTEDFKQRAEAKAGEEKRSLSSYIEVVVEKDIASGSQDDWLNS